MAFQNRSQKLILGWILQICLLVLLSNPTSVAGIEFPSLSSFRGLRGAAGQDVDNEVENFDYADEEEDMDWEDSSYDLLEDLPEEEAERQRELHPGRYRRGNYWNYGGWYGTGYGRANVYYPYHGHYYGAHYNYYGYKKGYYGGYYNRRHYHGRPFAYNDGWNGWDDWVGPGNFFV